MRGADRKASGASTARGSKTSTSARAPARAALAVPPALSLSIQYGVDDTRLPRWRLRRWVQQALAAAALDGLSPFKGARLSLRLTGRREARQLNRDFRGRDYATNVLTFEYGLDPEGIAQGDIVICLPVLEDEARRGKKPLIEHATHLTVHGVLHALGYDHIHERDAHRMETLETGILQRMGHDDPYLLAEDPPPAARGRRPAQTQA